MNRISRRHMLKKIDKIILTNTRAWAGDWYVASVLDCGDNQYDSYWTTVKPAQENYISELVNLRNRVTSNSNLSFEIPLSIKSVNQSLIDLVDGFYEALSS